MASVSTQKYPINQRMPWVDKDGKLTAEAFRVMRSIADIVSSITIGDGEISTAQLADAAITEAKIADDGPVSTAKIADLAITSAKIEDGAVTEDKIADNAVTTSKILADAVTLGASSSGSDITVTFAAGETEIHTDDIVVTGGEVSILFTAKAESTNTDKPVTTYRLKRDGVTIATKVWTIGKDEAARDAVIQFSDIPSAGTRTYSVTCELAAITSVANTAIYIQLRNFRR